MRIGFAVRVVLVLTKEVKAKTVEVQEVLSYSARIREFVEEANEKLLLWLKRVDDFGDAAEARAATSRELNALAVELEKQNLKKLERAVKKFEAEFLSKIRVALTRCEEAVAPVASLEECLRVQGAITVAHLKESSGLLFNEKTVQESASRIQVFPHTPPGSHASLRSTFSSLISKVQLAAR
jgi:uncharacterized protein YoxC